MTNIFRKIKKVLVNPAVLLMLLDDRNIIRMDDIKYLKTRFKFVFSRDLKLDDPKTFNEKLQWLKLNDRNNLYTTMVDKYEAKEYVSKIIGSKYIIPTLGVYDNFDDINFEKLPNRFVIKCTHDSGSTIICKNKSDFNIGRAKRKINKCLKNNFYYAGREWPYLNVKPRIIIEQYMEDTSITDLEDYKIQCFNGKVDNIMVCVDRYTKAGVKYHYFDKNWKYLPYCVYEGIDENNVNVPKPKQLNEMIEIAEKLSKNIPQLRVDLYIINNQIYFGELTFFTNGGFDTTITEEADYILGNKLDLNIK